MNNRENQDFRLLLRNVGTEWKWLMNYILRYKLEILIYALIGIVGTAMGLGASVASKHLIDAVIARDSGTLGLAAALAAGLGLGQVLINAGTSRLVTVIATRVKNEIRSSIYEHILRCRWEDINKYHSGDLLNRLEGDVGAVSGSIVSYIPSIFTRLTQFLGSLAIVLYYDPTMVLFALISAPFVFFSSRFTAKMMRKYNQESREMNGRILSFSSESIQNLQSIKAFDLTRRYTRDFRSLLDRYRTLRLAHDKFSVLLTLAMSVLGLLVSYACYGWGVWRLWQGAISYGTMMLFLQLSGSLTAAFSSLVSLAPSAISIATAAGRIKEITDLPMEPDRDRAAAKAMAEFAEGVHIRCDDVTYCYADGDSPVLRNVSFEAAPGQTIAFVGPSGEGKTTILRLLLGLVEPSEGSLTVTGGGETLTISDSTRRLCAYVPQGNTIFSGTIGENLRVVAPHATDEALIEALKTADAWGFVSQLPQGLDTRIGERGVNFSEGQIQRISIARAVLRQAPVLIMDEATSALDSDTEERVLKALMASAPHRTCILTTHRPSMLRYCASVYRLTEHGSLIKES
ncbi:MAG: ABC transporter ATP-binding protein [Ruminococcaceae bacterium]|nr:ABC transporter ATP-binding protein [Oscillospiraceae bacterium]